MPLRAVAIVLASWMIAASPAAAQGDYPARSITMIVPFAAGGSTDVIARVMAEAMRSSLGQAIVVDNRGGAGGSLGTAAIARATPDGYTIGMGTASTLAINPATYRSLPYDVTKDLAPVTNIAVVPNIMTVFPGLAAKSTAELVALAKAEPGRLAYGSSGIGSVSHLMGEQFKMATGANLAHVPYRGVGPALNDVVAGHIQVMYDNLPTSLPLVEGGKLRALAVSSSTRLPALPDVPTFAELGLEDLNWMAFFGIVAPAAVPPDVIARLNEAARKALTLADVREKLVAQQATPVGNSPAAFAAEIARELARHSKAASAAGIKIE